MKVSGVYRTCSVALLSFCLLSCGTVDRESSGPQIYRNSQIGAVLQADTGEDVVRHLTKRYADTRANCGAPSQPAFLCTGIMIRVTGNNPTYHVWENSPDSIAKGGVSFSYIRADARHQRLAFGGANGYIMNAYFFASQYPLHPEVLCFFPLDAWTVDRDDKGCGAYKGIADSKACQSQNITTAQQWFDHYNSHPTNRHQSQCGFDVRNALNASAGPAFAAGIAAMGFVTDEVHDTQNELVLAAWNNGEGPNLPLEAFFYLTGTASGRADAQRNQLDLIETHGIRIPVIRLTLPSNETDPPVFTFDPADQFVPPPPSKNG